MTNSMFVKGLNKGTKLFTRHVVCTRCGHYGRLRLSYQERTWSCLVCGRAHDLSRAVIEANDGNHYLDEIAAHKAEADTLAFLALG